MKKVVVVGSINIDLIARTRHAPAASETVNSDEIFLIPGGKGANQAVGMARLGLEVTFVGRVGKDFFGTYLIHELEKENLNTSCIFQDGNAMTSIAMIILEESGENRIIVSQRANYQISTTDIDQAIGEIEKADLVVCHFGRSHPVLNYVLQIAKSKQKKVLLNPAPAFPLSSDILKSVDYLVVNEGEAELALRGEHYKTGEKLASRRIKTDLITYQQFSNKGYRKRLSSCQGTPPKRSR